MYKDQDGLNLSLSRLPSDLAVDVVVVDDGSEPPLKCPEIDSPHQVFLLRLENNQGIEYALNHGLRWIIENNYPYVARLDAGDLSLEGRLSRQAHFLETNPDYALIGGQVLFVDAEGREIVKEHFPTPHEAIKRIMHARNCFIHPAVMLSTQVLREIGLYSANYKAAEDYELFFRIAQNYKVANLEDEVVSVYLNPQGISAKKRQQQILSRLKVMLHYFDPLIKESYIGIIKSLALLITPINLVRAAKRILGKRRGWL